MTPTDRFGDAIATLRATARGPADFESRVVAAIGRAARRRRQWRHGAMVAVVAWVAVVLGGRWRRGPAPVEFVVELPAATAVSLVGDFNDWDETRTPLARQSGTGRWSARVELPRGLYRYGYLVDGVRWSADPTSSPSADDDFGEPISVRFVEGR